MCDDDIFGRDKLKRSIMEAWHGYYQILIVELEVIFYLQRLLSVLLII